MRGGVLDLSFGGGGEVWKLWGERWLQQLTYLSYSLRYSSLLQLSPPDL